MLSKTLRRFTLSGLALVTMSGMIPAHALTFTVTTSPGTLYNTDLLTGFQTLGDMMDGMSVTANFLGGGSETLSWADTGAGSGGVTGTGWSLSLSGDTFNNPWVLTTDANTALAGLTINGIPGKTIFDILQDSGTPSTEHTPGSANGKPFSSVTGPSNLDILANYTNQILFQGTFYGDEYGELQLSFTNVDGLGASSTLTFVSDTDNSVFEITIVPEPMSLALMGIGLGGLGFARRRKVD